MNRDNTHYEMHKKKVSLDQFDITSSMTSDDDPMGLDGSPTNGSPTNSVGMKKPAGKKDT